MPKRIETWTPPWVRKRRDAERPSSHERGYGSAAWQRVRLAVIARDQVCQMCGSEDETTWVMEFENAGLTLTLKLAGPDTWEVSNHED